MTYISSSFFSDVFATTIIDGTSDAPEFFEGFLIIESILDKQVDSYFQTDYFKSTQLTFQYFELDPQFLFWPGTS